MRASEALRQAVARRALPPQPSPDTAALAAGVLEAGGANVSGLVFFGSRRSGASPNPWSGYDLFVLTSGARGFYRSLAAAGVLRRSPLLVAGLNRLLPPNQISIPVQRGELRPLLAKCAVIELATFVRETSARRRDHFCIGRAFQPTQLLFARDDATRERILGALVEAHVETFTWVRPWLPPSFDVDGYCRTLLRVSMSREIRPEPEGRAEALWLAQRDELREVYGVLLADLAAAGELRVEAEGTYALARHVGRAERLRKRIYFRWSMVRATVRWFKYVVTFEDWLDYIRHKAERHTGQPIELTRREQRWPLLFLWPRLVRYLRQKDKRGPS